MSIPSVILIQIGQLEWRRWMIFHRVKYRYWAKGRWRKRRRDGELWYDRAEAEIKMDMVRSGS